MKVYAIELQYEGVQRLFSTREAAEIALDDDREYPGEYGYFISEWEVE